MKQVALFAMSLLLAASSAIAQDVRYNFAFDTHFKKFKTYEWVEVKEAQKVDDVKDTEIEAAHRDFHSAARHDCCGNLFHDLVVLGDYKAF